MFPLSLTVLTRNLYLGADLEPVVAALLTGGDAAGSALVSTAEAVRAEVEATDFRVRARLVAREVVEAGADLVGLQEVATWRFGGEPPVDFLTELLMALSRLGAAYDVGVVGDRAHLALPTDQGGVGLTVRDAVLVRGGLAVAAHEDRTFEQTLELEVGGRPLRLARGLQWLDVESDLGSLRFVNTHLEFYDAGIALAQASELVESLPEDRAVLVVGDVNAAPGSPTYERLTRTLDDLWLVGAPGDPGPTCGAFTGLRDTIPFFSERIDLVLGRAAAGSRLEVAGAWRTGVSAEDRDPATGLWPSDHAGVLVRLRGL